MKFIYTNILAISDEVERKIRRKKQHHKYEIIENHWNLPSIGSKKSSNNRFIFIIYETIILTLCLIGIFYWINR